MKQDDFIDVSDDVETLEEFNDDMVETLDFDEQISNEIDQMLEEVLPEKKEKIEDEVLEKVEDKKLELYAPDVKNFNIKNKKTLKIVKKSMLYAVILILFTFEFFINKAGDALNDLRVYASDNQPIMIIQNNKYGYIDYTGSKIVNPKYNYGEDFIKGYAIVKDSSNLPLIIDKGGKEVIPTGSYFTLYRAGSDIIASKTTKKGLKYGVLDSNLKEKIPFEYNSISYKESVYTYSKDNTVGLINLEGKEIYKYKLSDSDDKKIDVYVSKVSENMNKYAVVTVNKSSQIVNISDGNTVTKPTLSNISADENNVFIVSNEGTKEFLYVENNKVLVDSESYTSLSMPSITAGALRAINNDSSYEFVSTKTLEQFDSKLSINDVYFGSGAFIYKTYNYKKSNISYVLVKKGDVVANLGDIGEIYKPFNNGFAIIKFSDGKYGYLKEDGTLLNNEHYDEAYEFDSYGDAIAKIGDNYGVINSKNKTVLKFKYQEIKMASDNAKKHSYSDNETMFYAGKLDNYYTIYNKNGRKVNNKKYGDVEFNNNYGIVKVSTDYEDSLLTTSNLSKINLTSFNTEYKAYENYIVLNNNYYNYKGKLIYVDKSEEGK